MGVRVDERLGRGRGDRGTEVARVQREARGREVESRKVLDVEGGGRWILLCALSELRLLFEEGGRRGTHANHRILRRRQREASVVSGKAAEAGRRKESSWKRDEGRQAEEVATWR